VFRTYEDFADKKIIILKNFALTFIKLFCIINKAFAITLHLPMDTSYGNANLYTHNSP